MKAWLLIVWIALFSGSLTRLITAQDVLGVFATIFTGIIFILMLLEMFGKLRVWHRDD